MAISNRDPLPSKLNNYGYYVSDWIWPSRKTNLIKSMLLFFDGISLALPADLAETTINRDPILAIPLADQGLLVNIDPSEALDRKSAENLARTLMKLVEDYHDRYERNFVTLTSAHWGGGVALRAARDFEPLLTRRKLMRHVRNTSLVKLEPQVSLLVLTLFAQAFRSRLAKQGILIHPITDSSSLVDQFMKSLRRYPPISSADAMRVMRNPN